MSGFLCFKQETAVEVRLSLVGSEMLIRDRVPRQIHDASLVVYVDDLFEFLIHWQPHASCVISDMVLAGDELDDNLAAGGYAQNLSFIQF